MRKCVAVLGGSFDPIHCAHVALVRLAVAKLQPDEVRIIPAGNPWQKEGLQAGCADRLAMARLAFRDEPFAVAIDDQEIRRSANNAPTYSIDTLRALRDELGAETSIVFLLGADQLQKLHTWRDWQQLFDHAHLFAVSRPGCSTDPAHVDADVAAAFVERRAKPEDLRSAAYGRACISEELALDISATNIRTALAAGQVPDGLVPEPVLDYIQQHHLYKKI